jgi:hypothetical protein
MDSAHLRTIHLKNLFDFHKKQSEHNSRLANKLFEESQKTEKVSDKYFDWVVTSCFYSAIHCFSAVILNVDSFMFYHKPFKKATLDEVRKHLRTNRDDFPKDAYESRHEIRKRIVQQNFVEISTQYNRLFDDSNTARYKMYPSTIDVMGKESLNRLKDIETWFHFKTVSSK